MPPIGGIKPFNGFHALQQISCEPEKIGGSADTPYGSEDLFVMNL